MDDQLIDELRMLRSRAYGPAPDIHDDPSALHRLQELERLARGPAIEQLPPQPPLPAAPLPMATPLPDLPEASAEAAPPVPAEPVIDAADENPIEEPARRRKWTKKRLAIAWLASLGVAILVTATVTGFVSRRIQADPREVAVLGVDAFAEWPGIFGSYTEEGEREPGVPEGGMAFQAFHGLSPFRMQNGMFAYGVGQTCLMIVETSMITDESNSFGGAIYNGCAAGEFPATVEILIDDENLQNLPDELLDAFPEGTALQFVLDGDEVIVLSDQVLSDQD
jgi:hypothetical protein